MKSTKKRSYLFAYLLILSSFLSIGMAYSQDFKAKLTITNIRNAEGRIQLYMYKNKDEYINYKPWKSFYISKQLMKNGQIKYEIPDIPKGIYGIAILDDENKNGKMDYSFLLPVEGYGFSDFYHKGWSKPSFDDFKFYISNDKDINIKVRYL